MYNSGRMAGRRSSSRDGQRHDGNIEKYLASLYRVRPDFCTASRATSCVLPDADAGAADDTPAHSYQTADRRRIVGTECEVTVYPWKEPRTEGSDHQTGCARSWKRHQPSTAAR